MAFKKVTLQQIATAAGCSKATVSVVLNGSSGNIAVSPMKEAIIKEIALRLGYSGNYHARSLTTGRSSAIGLLVGNGFQQSRHSGLTGQLVDGIDACVCAQGYDLLILSSVDGEDDLSRGARYLKQQRIDALIVPGLTYRASSRHWPPTDTPLVVAMSIEESPFPAVYLDQHSALDDALAHLTTLGHRAVLWTSLSVNGEMTSPARYSAFCSAVQSSGMQTQECWFEYHRDDQPLKLDGQIADYRIRFAGYCKNHSVPTAIFAYNEVAGLGIYQALSDMGLHVPRDVSIIGFDDLWGELAVPPMTVVSLNFREIGRQAAELALEIAGGAPVTPALSRTVQAALVVRQSTSSAPGSQSVVRSEHELSR